MKKLLFLLSFVLISTALIACGSGSGSGGGDGDKTFDAKDFMSLLVEDLLNDGEYRNIYVNASRTGKISGTKEITTIEEPECTHNLPNYSDIPSCYDFDEDDFEYYTRVVFNNYSNKGKLRTNGSFIEDYIAKTLSGTMQISGKYDVELTINFMRSNNTWTGTATANGVDVSEVFKKGFLD